jgi:Single-stranded DNA-binding replication protein A (RPA), large (70 kD) subunit and related ssDNA-binding proteins
MSDLRTHAAEITEQFSDHIDVDSDEVEAQLETLVNDYSVPVDEARRSVTSSYLDEAGMDRDEFTGGGGAGDNATVQVGDIDEDEQWIDVRATVAELFESDSDAISQAGLLGDESGTTRFVAFETSDLPLLEAGQSYELTNLVTDEYQGRYSVKLNKTTDITELDADIEVGDDEETVSGALVDVQSGSGLIKRCPEEECTRVLQNGRCNEHGQVDGDFDLRIKGVLDDGGTVTKVIFDEDATENLTGIGLEEAKQMARDALDTAVVAEEMSEEIVGRYYEVTGPRYRGFLLANQVSEVGAIDPEAALIKARSM